MNNLNNHQIKPGRKKYNLYRILQSIAFFLGLLLLVYLIHRMGLKTMLLNISRIGPWFVVICLLGGIWLVLQAMAWWMLSRNTPLPALLMVFFRIKVITDAINTVLPSANLGGETARAYLTSRYLSLKESLAGIMVDKTFEIAGGILFMIIGFGLALVFSIFPGSLLLPPEFWE